MSRLNSHYTFHTLCKSNLKYDVRSILQTNSCSPFVATSLCQIQILNQKHLQYMTNKTIQYNTPNFWLLYIQINYHTKQTIIQNVYKQRGEDYLSFIYENNPLEYNNILNINMQMQEKVICNMACFLNVRTH